MLTTPALLLALGGGIGTAIPAVWQEYKAWRLGVQANQLQQIEDQQVLWEKNLHCLRVKPVYTITLDADVEVGVILCQSGDALLRYQRAPEVVTYTWIPYPRHKPVPEPQHSSAGDLVTPQTRVVYGATRCVILQARLLAWVLADDDTLQRCHIEYITLVRGTLLERRELPCTRCEDATS
jgi:hypothetical protein